MEISYLRRKEIDIDKWNTCIESNLETASVSAMSWYLDACCSDWGALIMGDYRTVIPLPLRKKFGIAYVYPPFFAPRLGVLGEKITASELDTALHFASKKFKWIDLIFSPDTDINTSNYQCFTHRVCTLDLQNSYDVLQKNYHKKHIYNCNRSQEGHLTFVQNANIEDVISLFSRNMGENKQVGYRAKDYRELKDLVVLLQSKNAIEVVGVEDNEKKLCAGAFFTHRFGKYNFLFSGREQTKIQNRSMYFLLDNFILQHAQSAVSLQINGSNNDQLAKFYAGFGTQEHQSHQITIEKLPIFLKKVLFIYRKLR